MWELEGPFSSSTAAVIQFDLDLEDSLGMPGRFKTPKETSGPEGRVIREGLPLREGLEFRVGGADDVDSLDCEGGFLTDKP